MKIKQLEPTYLRYVYDGLDKGSISSNNPTSLPIGFIGLFEDEFPSSMPLGERMSLLNRLAMWALLKGPVSIEMVAEILNEDSDRTKKLVDRYSKWFNSTMPGKYVLYHDRLRTYLLQKLSDREVQVLNEKLISFFDNALNNNGSVEAEIYALEYLSIHLFIESQLGNRYQRLHDFVNQEDLWKRQVSISKEYKWSQRGVQFGIKEGARREEELLTLESSVSSIRLLKKENTNVDDVIKLIQENYFELAIHRIDKFSARNQIIIYFYLIFEFFNGLLVDHSHKKDYCKIIVENIKQLIAFDKTQENENLKLYLNKFYPQELLYDHFLNLRTIGIDISFIWDQKNGYKLSEIITYKGVDFDVIFELLAYSTPKEVLISLKLILSNLWESKSINKFSSTFERLELYLNKIEDIIYDELESGIVNEELDSHYQMDTIYYNVFDIYLTLWNQINHDDNLNEFTPFIEKYFNFLIGFDKQIKDFHVKKDFYILITIFLRKVNHSNQIEVLKIKLLELLKSTKFKSSYVPILYEDILNNFQAIHIDISKELEEVFGVVDISDNLMKSELELNIEKTLESFKANKHIEHCNHFFDLVNSINETNTSKENHPDDLRGGYYESFFEVCLESNDLDLAILLIFEKLKENQGQQDFSMISMVRIMVGIMKRLNKENRFEDSEKLSNEFEDYKYTNNGIGIVEWDFLNCVDIANRHIEQGDNLKAINRFYKKSKYISHLNKSEFQLKLSINKNDNSKLDFYFLSIQYWINSFFRPAIKTDSIFKWHLVEELEPWGFIDQVENLINSLESIDLCFELLDVVPINYFKSHDSFKLAMVLYNLGEEQKANEIILNLDDNIFKLLYYIYSINKSKLDLDENFIENILLNISNPILQLQFLSELYFVLNKKQKTKLANYVMLKMVEFNNLIDCSFYTERIIYLTLLNSNQSTDYKNFVKNELTFDEIDLIYELFGVASDLCVSHYFEENNNKIKSYDSSFYEIKESEFLVYKEQVEDIDPENHEFHGDYLNRIIKLFPFIYKYDKIKIIPFLDKSKIVLKSYPFNEDYFSEIFYSFVKKQVETSSVNKLLRLANKISIGETVEDYKSLAYYEILKKCVLNNNLDGFNDEFNQIEISDSSYPHVGINCIAYLCEILIDHSKESFVKNIITNIKFKEVKLKDSLIKNVLSFIYLKSNHFEEDYYYLISDSLFALKTQFDLAFDCFKNDVSHSNLELFFSHLKVNTKQGVDVNKNITNLTNVLINSSIKTKVPNHSYIYSKIKNTNDKQRFVYNIIESLVDKRKSSKEILSFVEPYSEVYANEISNLLVKKKRFNEGIEIANGMEYSFDTDDWSSRSDTLVEISLKIMEFGEIEKSIKTFELAEKAATKWLESPKLSELLLKHMNKNNYDEIITYLDLINKNRLKNLDFNIPYRLSIVEMEEILLPELTIALTNILEVGNSSMKNDPILRLINLNINKIDFIEFLSDHDKFEGLYKVAKLLNQKNYFNDSLKLIKKLSKNFLDNDEVKILSSVKNQNNFEELKTFYGHENYLRSASDSCVKFSLFSFDLYCLCKNLNFKENLNNIFNLTVQLSCSISALGRENKDSNWAGEFMHKQNFVYKELVIKSVFNNEQVFSDLTIVKYYHLNSIRYLNFGEEINYNDKIISSFCSQNSISNHFPKEINNHEIFNSFENLNFIGHIKLAFAVQNVFCDENVLIKKIPIINPHFQDYLVTEKAGYSNSLVMSFYKKMIIRNERYKRLKKIKAPTIILDNEKKQFETIFLEFKVLIDDISIKNSKVRFDNTIIVLKLLKELSCIYFTKFYNKLFNKVLENINLIESLDFSSSAYYNLSVMLLEIVSNSENDIPKKEWALEKSVDISKQIFNTNEFTKFCSKIYYLYPFNEFILIVNSNKQKINHNELFSNISLDGLNLINDKYLLYVNFYEFDYKIFEILVIEAIHAINVNNSQKIKLLSPVLHINEFENIYA